MRTGGHIDMQHTSPRHWESWVSGLPRRVRRVIALISLFGLPGMYAWSAFWLTTSVPKIIWGPISFLLIGATAGGSLILYTFVRDRANTRADLDERQRQLRDRAMVLCYQVLSAVVVFAGARGGIPVLPPCPPGAPGRHGVGAFAL